MPLTVENAGALVGGIHAQGDAMKPVLVRFEVAAAFYFGGEVQEVGAVVELPKLFAQEMQSANRGKVLPDEPTLPVASADETKAAPAAAAADTTAAPVEERKGMFRRKGQ